MSTHKYTYIGTQEIFIPQFGTVMPGQSVESVEPINHPDFEEHKGDAPKRSK